MKLEEICYELDFEATQRNIEAFIQVNSVEDGSLEDRFGPRERPQESPYGPLLPLMLFLISELNEYTSRSEIIHKTYKNAKTAAKAFKTAKKQENRRINWWSNLRYQRAVTRYQKAVQQIYDFLQTDAAASYAKLKHTASIISLYQLQHNYECHIEPAISKQLESIPYEVLAKTGELLVKDLKKYRPFNV